MFKFLKDKINESIAKISDKIKKEEKEAEIGIENEEKFEAKKEDFAEPEEELIEIKTEEDAEEQDSDKKKGENLLEPEELDIKIESEGGVEDHKEEFKELNDEWIGIKSEEPIEEFKEEKLQKEETIAEEKEETREPLLEEKAASKEKEFKEYGEESKGFFSKLKDKILGKEELKKKKNIITEIKESTWEKEEVKEESKKSLLPEVEEIKRGVEEELEKSKEIDEKGFFERLKEKVVTKKINEKQFEDLFWDLEIAMLEGNVAVEVIEKIKMDLKEKLVEKPIKRGEIETIIQKSLVNSITNLFDVEKIDLISKIKDKKPYIICFVGINGSGKTTTIAKIAYMLKKEKKKCVISASDTFRAASIEQLQKHADNLGFKLIKHDYRSDPAAVAFDAINHAKMKNVDVVLIDTAGRMNENTNLMDEMKKIIRVAKPDLKIFVGEAITGNDCVEQAKKFDEAIGIDGIILAKADIDEKGGAAVSISYVTKKPIIFLGVGQGYDDLRRFEPSLIINGLGLDLEA